MIFITKKFLLPLTMIDTTKSTTAKTSLDFDTVIYDDRKNKKRSVTKVVAAQVAK